MPPITSAQELFEQLKSTRNTCQIDGVDYWVVEGDLILNEVQLRAYAQRRWQAVRGDTGPQQEGLVAMTDERGNIVRWKPGKVLSYAVRQDTFSDAQYDTVVGAMEDATSDWMDTCGVEFEHWDHLDDGMSPGDEAPLFVVRGENLRGSLLAVAFFPNDPPARRWVAIDSSFFRPNLSFDRVGILRHELGHVLGFRHEHIRSGAPPICGKEEEMDRVFEITDYDPKSVMHYLCGGVGDPKLMITGVDRVGAQMIYGPPLSKVSYFE